MAKMGRPKGFDVDQALEQAVQVFYDKGYEATTLDDLTGAMGINRPSLYATFGNKEALFLRALERYWHDYARAAQELLRAEPDTRQAIQRFLQWTAEWHTHNQMRGCLIANTSPDCRADQPAITQQVNKLHRQTEDLLLQRLQRGVDNRDLPPDTDLRGLAQFFNGVIQGMAVLAREQHNIEALHNIVRFAMRVWPVES